MDKRYIEQNNVTERFVLNQLTETELDEFLVYQMMNPGIQKEISKVRHLRNSVRGISNFSPDSGGNSRSDTSYRWIFPVLLLTILILGVFAVLNPNQNNTSSQQFDSLSIEPKTNSTENRIVPEEASSEFEKTESAEEISKEPAKTQAQPSDKQQPKVKIEKSIPPKSRPIAAADLKPNPYFERNLGASGGVRSNDSFEINVTSPILGDTVLVSENQFNIAIKGITDSETEPEVNLVLYSNKESDYINETPISSQKIQWKPGKEKGFGFESQVNQKLNPGLYYFSIENEMQIYYIGKIWVLNA